MNPEQTITPAGTPHYEALVNRREFLLRGGGGFGAVALSYLMGQSSLSRALAEPAKAPHFEAKAKSVIFLFMEGGPSFGPIITAMGEVHAPLLESRRAWKQHGKSGIWVSDWLPHTAECVDDLAVIRSCWADGLNHANGVCQMNTGSVLGGRPSLGSWVTYGLGTENSNLPAFVVLCDNNGQVVGGPRNWGGGFMPAAYQGVRLQGGGEPIPNLRPPEGVDPARQEGKLAFLREVNQRHAQSRLEYDELDARIQSYELAYRMQAEAPEAVDLSRESEQTLALYGIDRSETATFGKLCLLSRRMVERGVRFVQLYHGTGSKWDAHSGIERNHSEMCLSSDQPVAGLLQDLKQRGLLDQTLVIWGGEFGRTPMSEKGDGRDHNPTGFTMWMAGGGVKGGQVIGQTDELGLHATKDRLHVHDLHATIMHLLGMDHTRVIYTHQGRPERVDMNEGTAFRKITGDS